MTPMKPDLTAKLQKREAGAAATIPKSIRNAYGFEPGDIIVMEVDGFPYIGTLAKNYTVHISKNFCRYFELSSGDRVHIKILDAKR